MFQLGDGKIKLNSRWCANKRSLVRLVERTHYLFIYIFLVMTVIFSVTNFNGLSDVYNPR
jgi:hypothetical protein